MTECTSTVLLTDAAKPHATDASDVISIPKHGFALRLSFPFSD